MLPTIIGRVSAPIFMLNRYVNQYHLITESYSFGGIELSNPTQGLEHWIWQSWTDGKSIYIRKLKHIITGEEYPIADYTTLYQGSDITEVSLAFDQNMRPIIAFVENGIAKYMQYDTNINDYRIKPIPKAHSPRVCMDDHRKVHLTQSDVILSYIIDGELIARTQRELFKDVISVKRNVGSAWFLRRIGYTEGYDFRFWMYRRECYEAETGIAHPPPVFQD